MTDPRISVVICTRNRARLLRLAVGSVFAQSLPPGDFELIVVDNASSDDTPAALSALRAQKPATLAFDIVGEPRLGLSHARNTAVAAARAHKVAFLDDDAMADAGWLAALCNGFARAERVAAVGGPIRPIWPAAPPAWLTRDLEAYYSILDRGAEARPIRSGEWLGGANVAFLRQALLEVGGFAVTLGRHGASLLSNEELDVLVKLAGCGYEAWYAPDARIAHHIHAGRLTRRWLLRRSFWQGISNVAMREPEAAAALAKLSPRRVEWTLLRTVGIDWIKEQIQGDLLGRPSRMEALARRALGLGEQLARSCAQGPDAQSHPPVSR